MKMDGEFGFPYFLVGMVAGAIVGTLFAPRSGEETRKYLREQSNKGLNHVNEQATRLRAAAEALIERGKELMACQHQPINTATEAEAQANLEERRNTLGG
ncbi:MAG TPA: YtxH domain-containing protein [Candidatus Binatia bacterium]